MIIHVQRNIKISWDQFRVLYTTGKYYVEYQGKGYRLQQPTFNLNTVVGEVATVDIEGCIYVT